MIRVALAGLLGRKLRTVLTALAIVLGVAMVSGTLVLTDSIDKAFNFIYTDVRQGSDAVISGKSAIGSVQAGQGTFAPTVAATLLTKVRDLPDVQDAEGSVNGEAQLIDQKGKAIVFGGAPNLGFSIANPDSPFNVLTLVDGAWPKAGEVVIDSNTASKKHFVVGGNVGVQAEGPVQPFRISGIVKFGTASALGGATLAGFDLPTAQTLFRKHGRYDEISVSRKPGATDVGLLKEIRSVLPPTAQVRTGTAQAAEDAKQTDSFITFLRGFLLAFGGIALFVGSFVIANSLSITIAQRTREFATVRTLGASRRQVLTSIVIEALVIGVLASVTGLFLGLGLAKGLFRLFNAVGFTLPNSGIVFGTSTIVIALAAGIIVTLVASLRPALRATRVPPIAAVREGATLPFGRFHRFRTVGSVLTTALGFAALAYGLFKPGLGTTGVLVAMGIGALLIFIGVAMLSERFIRPLAWALGWPATRIGGASGALARDNARRNPQRTASTAAALMIGLALVTLVAVLAAGITSSFRGAVNDIWQNADYAITAQNNFTPIPPTAADAVARNPIVEAVGNVRTGNVGAFGKKLFATAVNPPSSTMFHLNWITGSSATMATLGANGAFVDKSYAKSHKLVAGSPVTVTFADGQRKTFVVKGIFDPPAGGSPFGRITISQRAWDAYNESLRNIYSFVRVRGGESDANLATLETSLKSFPNAKVQTRQQFIHNQISGLNSVLNILYVLLALSVIVSLFGIVNTLVLTVFERTREIGMLRAIGMTRRQVRRMIRHESVITALIGGVLGIVLGIVLGGLLVARVSFIQFSLPVVSLIIFALMAIVVGILAAIFPARRAARLNVLEALQYE
ncbi:MAG TPA: FtsX-like permease family protein [Gaiellaceae bacterium]|jgi:putative ABC transport system permease protein|nr:FtsX-like permease family protein [Gaiellaceae bacterium]